MEGSDVGKYRIGTIIGRGAVGVVYHGWDNVLARKVAIKVLPLLGGDENAQERRHRFLREAQALAGLHHPNIVAVYDYGETDAIAYIAMELITGQPLGSILKADGKVPAATARALMCGLLAGLQHSHEHGIIHRDIKPSNIIVTTNQVVKITDFGIAHFENSDLTRIGTVMGTPAYMSPEQVLGDRVDSRTDLYSAGVILYQMLLGHRPFEGGTASIMHKIVTTEPELPADLNGAVSPEIATVIRKALAKRAEQRYQTAAEFAGAVERAIADVSQPAKDAAATFGFAPKSRARREGKPASARQSDGTVQTVTRQPISPERTPFLRMARADRLRPVAILGGLALVLAAGGASFMAFRPHSASKPAPSPSAAAVIAAPDVAAPPAPSAAKYSDLPARPVDPAPPAPAPVQPRPAIETAPAALPLSSQSLDLPPRPIPMMAPPDEPEPAPTKPPEPGGAVPGAARGDQRSPSQRAPGPRRSPPPANLARNPRPDERPHDAQRAAPETNQSYTAWIDQQRRSHPVLDAPPESSPEPPASPPANHSNSIGSYVTGPGGARTFQLTPQVPD